MTDKPLQTFTITRRINLGEYEFYELSTTISNVEELSAFRKAAILMNKAFKSVGLDEQITHLFVKGDDK